MPSMPIRRLALLGTIVRGATSGTALEVMPWGNFPALEGMTTEHSILSRGLTVRLSHALNEGRDCASQELKNSTRDSIKAHRFPHAVANGDFPSVNLAETAAASGKHFCSCATTE
ncbi:hypothetical protein K438DRAFT_1183573 [Mycena galopus ATCC 62051]|nr:hypothetical protein K438DRAFT_1183573 [Mycena galopus ATCC 62051]